MACSITGSVAQFSLYPFNPRKTIIRPETPTEKMTRVVGLIGGMSWQTTVVYYTEINQYVRAKLGGVHSANLLINSIDYAEIAQMIQNEEFESMVEMLSKCGQDLKSAGAEFLVFCANVAHKAADRVEKATGLPVIHIMDSTAEKVLSSGHNKVGLLGTRAVMEQEFCKSRLTDKFGLEVVVPDQDFRSRVDGLIFRELSKPVVTEDVRSYFHKVYAKLVEDHQVDCIVLACTELRLVFGKDDFTVPTFETTTVHAESIAEWALRESD